MRVGSPADTARIRVRNRLTGTVSSAVTSLERGAVNSTVHLEIAGGRVLTAVVTNESVDELGLADGAAATAIIKASHVILAVAA